MKVACHSYETIRSGSRPKDEIEHSGDRSAEARPLNAS